ncbi:MAG: hypothetical protein AB7S26_40360 [Sandaracinaceae bacterium]
MRVDWLLGGFAGALIGVLVSAFPGRAQVRELELPGAFCQPESDEDDVSYVNHAYQTHQAYDLVCPLLATAHYPEDVLGSSQLRMRVYDGSSVDVVMVQGCHDLSETDTGSVCGAAAATGLSFQGWFTLAPSPKEAMSTSFNVHYLFVELPSESVVHSYRAFSAD